MNFDNFVKEDKIIDLIKANLVALKYLVLFAIIFSVPFSSSGRTVFPLIYSAATINCGIYLHL